MPSLPLIVVLVLNLLVAIAYLIVGLIISPLMRKRREEEAQETRAELLERYRAAQGQRGGSEALPADVPAQAQGVEPAVLSAQAQGVEPAVPTDDLVEAHATAALEALFAPPSDGAEPSSQDAAAPQADVAAEQEPEPDGSALGEDKRGEDAPGADLPPVGTLEADGAEKQDSQPDEPVQGEGVQDVEAGFQTRVLDDRPDIVTEGPAIVSSVDAAQSEYSPLRIVLNTLVMIGCPVAGPLFFGLSWLLKNVVFRKPVDVADVIFSKARVKPAEEADPEHEMNIAPLTEAVSVTDDYHLRSLMLNVLSGEMNASLASISEALASDDSESAHYAASYLSDAINKLRSDTQKLYLQVLEDVEGSERVVDYAIERARAEGHETVLDEDREYVRRMLVVDGCTRYLDQVETALKQGIFTPLETEELVRNMERIGSVFYEEAPSEMQPVHYESLTLRLQQVGDEDAADLWIARDREVHGEMLSYYTCRLQVLYVRRDRDAFFDVLDELKNSSVTVDKATLDAIRLFERGVE